MIRLPAGRTIVLEHARRRRRKLDVLGDARFDCATIRAKNMRRSDCGARWLVFNKTLPRDSGPYHGRIGSSCTGCLTGKAHAKGGMP